MIHISGESGVCHSQDLIGQSTNEGYGLVHPLKPRDGDGHGLIDGLPVMDLVEGRGRERARGREGGRERARGREGGSEQGGGRDSHGTGY